MLRRARLLLAAIAIVSLVAATGVAYDPSKDKGQVLRGVSGGTTQHKDYLGKALLGENINRRGPHMLQVDGKYNVIVNVSGGKLTALHVRHADRGPIPVTKYRTTKDMAKSATSNVQFAAYLRAQSQNFATMWIGYGYIDDWGEESIYWFPYEMTYDGDANAVEYFPPD